MSSIFIVVNQTNHFYHQNFHAVSFMDIPLYLLTFIFFTTRTSHQPDCSMTAKHLTPMNLLMQSTCFVFRELLVLLSQKRLFILSTLQNDVEIKFFGCHGDGDNQSRVRAILRLCNAHLLVSYCIRNAGLFCKI